MNYVNVLLIALCIVFTAILLNREQNKKNRKKREKGHPDDFPDFNKRFLENARGKQVIDLVKVYNPQDMIVLRSILDAEGIETYVKSNHFGELYPTYDLHNFATSVISIFNDNSAAAKKVVQDYLLTLNKKSYAEESNALEDAVKTSGLLVGIPPESSKFVPELLI